MGLGTREPFVVRNSQFGAAAFSLQGCVRRARFPEARGQLRAVVLAERVRGGPPAVDALAIRRVIRAECATEGWLLIEHDEEMRDQEEAGYEGEQLDGLIEKGGSGDGKGGTDIHGVADEAIGSADDEAARRIKGRGGAFADEGEGANA